MTFFGFGQTHPDYSVRLLNEREVRAGTGILHFFGMSAFVTTFHTGDFTLTRLMVLAFGVDFAIRLFVGPAFAPSLVLVRNQEPELTGAPQKRFAWAPGLVAPRAAALDAPRMPFAASIVSETRCEVPAFARRMGYEQHWLRHNGCL